MAGRSSRQKGGGKERIQALVQQKLEEGLQYEALQLYRGVVARKSARGDYDGAVATAEQGICVLIGAGYADSATELGSVLISILSDHALAPTGDRLDVVKRVNTAYEDSKEASKIAEKNGPASADDRQHLGSRPIDLAKQTGGKPASNSSATPVGILQARFLKQAVGWTSSHGHRIDGEPSICALLGRCLWREGDRKNGTKYLVLAEEPQELCDLIVQDYDTRKERDMAAARAIVWFASKSSLRDANAMLDAYKRHLEGKPRGLIAFCGMLLKICEYDAGPVFQNLLEAYRAELSADESLLRAVERVGLIYFGIRLRPPSMLDNILGMFGGASS